MTPRPIQRTCFSAFGVLAVPPHELDEPRQDGRDVHREVEEPEARRALEERGRGQRGLRAEQGELEGDVGDGRQVEERDQPAARAADAGNTRKKWRRSAGRKAR